MKIAFSIATLMTVLNVNALALAEGDQVQHTDRNKIQIVQSQTSDFQSRVFDDYNIIVAHGGPPGYEDHRECIKHCMKDLKRDKDWCHGHCHGRR